MAMRIAFELPDAHTEAITALAFDVKRNILYCAAEHTDIKAWDLKEGGTCAAVMRCHKGWVRHLVFCAGANLLVSGSVDGCVVIWDDRYRVLQIVDMESAIGSLAWNSRLGVLAVGRHSSVRLFLVDVEEAVQMCRARNREHNPAAAAGPQKPFKLSDVPTGRKSTQNAVAKATSKQPVCLLRSKGAAECGIPESAHTDVVSGIVVTDSGLVFTAQYSRCICLWDMERPSDTFKKVEAVHDAAIISVTYDCVNNWFLTGAFDGCFKVWSSEGKFLDAFHGVHDDRTHVVYAPMTHSYWQVGRFGHVVAYDARPPAAVTAYVEESNQLAGHSITGLWVQRYSDAVFGATSKHSVIQWRYAHSGAYRTFSGHAGWIECIMCIDLPLSEEDQLQRGSSILNPAEMATSSRTNGWGRAECIFTACATGWVHKWLLNKQQLCDVYEIQDSYKVDSRNVLCMAHSRDLHAVIAAGVGCFIKLISLERKQRWHGDSPLPDVLEGHSKPVTALAVLQDYVLVSASQDQQMRFWDLNTMKELVSGRKEHAHQAPMAGLCYVEQRNELASWALENVAKVWDVRMPHRAKILFEMETPGEISQVAWMPWLTVWITASDDESIRLWNTEGCPVKSFNCNGGSVTALLVDAEQQLLLAAMQDFAIRVFDMKSPVPKAKYIGHWENVRGIALLREQHGYVSCSWDKTIRVWRGPGRPDSLSKHHKQLLKLPDFSYGSQAREISNYEKEHPLKVPRSLLAPPVPALFLSQQRPEVEVQQDDTPKAGLAKKLEQLDIRLKKEKDVDPIQKNMPKFRRAHSRTARS